MKTAGIQGSLRRNARALLLGGALAAMAFGNVAFAQVVFRSASSSTQPVPTFRSATQSATSVGYRGAGTYVGVVSGNLTPGLPPGWQPNDIHILIVEQKDNVVSTVPAGWTSLNAANSGATHRAALWWRRAVAGDTNPLITHTGGNSTSARIIGFSGVDTTTAFDVANSFTVSPSDNTVEAAAITTVTPNAMLVFTRHMAAAQAASTVPAGWTSAFHSFTPAGTDSAIAADYKQLANGVLGAQPALVSTVSGAANAISHGAQLALRPVNTAIAIDKPAGTTLNDVMIASIGFRPNTATITPPAGWTLVRRVDNAGGGSVAPNSLAVYQKVAGAAEPLSYTWTLGGGITDSTGGIQTFFNVDTTTPIDVENGNCTPQPACATLVIAHDTPSVTTTAVNTMVVTSHTVSSADVWTAPAGMTQAFTVASQATGATGQATTGAWVPKPAAGATGVKTASLPAASPNGDGGNAHILALRPAMQASVTITKPAGTLQNDVLVASIGFQPNTLTITPPAGWTLVRRVDNANPTANSLAVYRLVAGAAEPASYTWTFSAAGYSTGGILAFSGVDNAAPVDVENGNTTAASLSHATPSVTTTFANTMLVTSFTYSSAGTWTPPAGMAKPVDVQHGVQSTSIAYVLQASAGATGVKTATASSDADVGNAHILALKPGGGAAIVTPGGFNAFETSSAAGAITGVIKTKVAGLSISLDVIALNTAKTAVEPAFVGAVRVEVLDSSNDTAALDANSCRATWTMIQTVSPDPVFVAGDSGRKTITFSLPNSFPNLRLRITYPAGAPTVTGCSTDNFANRPGSFISFSATDSDWQTAGITRTLSNVAFAAPPPPCATGTPACHKAGRPFTVRATAVDGSALQNTTSNYTGAPTATVTTCGIAGPACTPTLGALTLDTTFAAGALSNSAASYDEVGSFSLKLVDSAFASVDSGDSTALEREIVSAVFNVGRFVPDHFSVLTNSPVFATACGTGGFTYIGQLFNYVVSVPVTLTVPVITVTAQNFANTTTTRYAGSWFRITNASVANKAYTAASGTLDVSALPGTDPVIASTGSGGGTLQFGSGSGLMFTRSSPVTPFPADISLAIDVIDADGIVPTAGNPVRFGAATLNNGIPFNSGKPMRFGRLQMQNALGLENRPLPILIETQYWNGSAFIRNPDDACTTLARSDIALSGYALNLNACETTPTQASVSFAAGLGTLTLSAPGAGNNGSVLLTANSGTVASGNYCPASPGAQSPATAANKSYLQGAWTGATWDENPSARATFGLFGGQPKNFIFFRENY